MVRVGLVLCLVILVHVALGGAVTYFYQPRQSAQVIMMTAVVPGCGNEIIEDGEQCDGGVLQGATCVSLGFTGGTLQCSNSCSLNTEDCSSADGSWWEVAASSWWPPRFLGTLFGSDQE
jgi:hypothetical protein